MKLFVGTVEKIYGKYIVVQDLEELHQIHLAKLYQKRVTIKVRRFYKTNTPKQKAYLHGVVIPIATAFMGYFRHQREHVYNHFKLQYLKAYDEKGNEYIRELREDSNDPVDTQLASWFTDQIRDFVVVEYDFGIPDPDKNYDKGYIEELVIEIERNG